MKTIPTTKKQRLQFVCLMLVAIVAHVWIGLPGKTCTQVLYVCTSVLALLVAFSCLKFLIMQLVCAYMLFVSSVFVPIDIAVIRGKEFGITWQHCVLLSSKKLVENGRPDNTDIVFFRSCCPITGVEPAWILGICVPQKANSVRSQESTLRIY